MAEEKQVEKNETTDEQIEGVSGGAIFDASNAGSLFSRPLNVAGDREHPWEVLDDVSGNVLARFSTKTEAQDYCKHYRVSSKRIRTMDQVEKMRDAYIQHEKYYENDSNWKNPHGVV